MTASISSEAIFSKFTAALLIDSGWYDVDFQLTEPFIYGKKRGCSFVEQVCQDPAKPSEFCYDDQDACTFGFFIILMCFFIIILKDGYRKGFCFKKDNFGDNCGYVTSTDMDSKDCRIYQAPRSVNIYGESFGPNSKCVKSNFAINGWTIQSEVVRCMEYKCSTGKVVFYIDGKEAGVCSKEKETINAPKGYQGTLECPNPETFCDSQYLRCPNFCSGKGYCFKGQCECKLGSGGNDCSSSSNSFLIN